MFNDSDEAYFIPLGETEVEGYDVAQICLNGHVINGSFRWSPQHNCDYCSECGQKTIVECPKCKATIPGQYHSSAISYLGALRAPAFCHACGSPYPWTESRLSAAKEYVRELEGLDANERGIMERSLDDLVCDTPKTQVAALRFKKYATKAGHTAMEGLKSILIEVMAETAKKAIWGPTP
jgi:hypothetical protein